MSRKQKKSEHYSERLSFGVTPHQKNILEELLRVKAKQGKAQHLTDLLREALNLYIARQDDIPGTRAAITRRLEGRLETLEDKVDGIDQNMNRLITFFQRKRGGGNNNG